MRATVMCGMESVRLTLQRLHVSDGQTKNGKFIRLAGECTAGGHHVTQLVHVHRHLAASTTLNLTVTLPNDIVNKTV